MQHIQGISRNQLQVSSLEDTISADNPVRFMDAFVNLIDLEKIGFQPRVLKTEGRPSFDSKVFLKIYLYGYLNGIRSSRRLEKECLRNIELQWLLEAICPNYHSIADFRKDNPKALKQLFKLFVSFLKDADLISGKTIAIDGTKSRSHNGKKANFNQKKIDKHLQYIEAKTQEYLSALDQNDVQENNTTITNIQQKIERLKQNKINYEHSLIMLVYNIKRSINILGVPDLIAKLKTWNSPYKRENLFLFKMTCLKLFLASIVTKTNQCQSKISLA
jgi:transposase